MVRSYTLPEDARRTIASQIAERLTPAARILALDGGHLALGEDFPISTLPLEHVRRGVMDLTNALYRTEYWHHQVRHGDVAQEFATSTPVGPADGDWRLEGVFTSDIAVRLDEAIRWVDETVNESGVAELLYAPAYGLTAMWWRRESGHDVAVLIVDMPEAFTHLERQHVYDGADFLARLRREPFIEGTPRLSATGMTETE